MKNLPKEKRDKIILIGLGALAIVAGLLFGLIGPQRTSLSESAKKKDEQESRIANANRLVSNVSDTQRNLAEATASLEAIETTMASGDMYFWVIQTVNAFKENYDIEIPQFSREISGEVGMFAKFPYKAAIFQLRGTARYRDFGRFVADFENAFPYMRIQNIELDPATVSNSTGTTAAGGPTTGPAPAGPAAKERLAFKIEIVALVKP